MVSKIIVTVMAVGIIGTVPAYAVEKPAGAAASPSGAPKDAAEHGSSMAGKDASVNEMKSHNATIKENSTMSDPNKNNKK